MKVMDAVLHVQRAVFERVTDTVALAQNNNCIVLL
jgi:hypothetical protein